MKLRYKIPLGLLGLFALFMVGLAITISYDKSCPTVTAASGDGEMMKSVRHYCYGAPEVLVYSDVHKPEPAANEVLVRVHAAGVNPYDWHFMRGSPYIVRLMTGIGAPKDPHVGVDYSGTVEAVGAEVTKFKPGDEVFGGAAGAFSEYVIVREDRAIVKKPASVSFEEAAGVGIAGVTALQALRDHGKLEAGQRVLINGASGGVGTFAVQLAKAMGAHVTGVCSGRNVEMVTALGADKVFNYKQEDYTDSGEQYDLVIDMVGNHSPLANRKVLTPNGRLIIVGGVKGDWIGPIIGPIKATISSSFVEQELKSFTARLAGSDMAIIADYMAQGSVTPVIDKLYPLSRASDAVAYSESGRARGKIIIQTH